MLLIGCLALYHLKSHWKVQDRNSTHEKALDRQDSPSKTKLKQKVF